MLIVTTLTAVGLGLYVGYIKPYRLQDEATQALAAKGVAMEWRPMEPAWLRSVLGVAMGQDVLRDCTVVKAEHCLLKDADLANLQYLPKLEKLYLARTLISDKGLVHLRQLYQLRRLSLWGTNISDDGLRHLARLRSLELLDIHDVNATPYQNIGTGVTQGPMATKRLTWDPEYVASFSTRPNALTCKCLEHVAGLKRLRKFEFSFPVDDRGVAILAQCPRLYLDTLVLQNVSEMGLEHVSRMESIREIVGIEVDLGDGGLGALGRMPNLRRLWLDKPRATPTGWSHLAAQRRLEILALQASNLTDDDLKHLAGLGRLRCLSLADSPVTDRGIVHLAGLKHVCRLDLRRTDVTNDCLDSLVGMAELESLAFDGELDDRSLESLARMRLLKQVWSGSRGKGLYDCFVSDAGLASLAKLECLPAVCVHDPCDGRAVAGVDIPEQAERLTDAGVAQLWPSRRLQRVVIRGRDVSLHALPWKEGRCGDSVELHTSLPFAPSMDALDGANVNSAVFDSPGSCHFYVDYASGPRTLKVVSGEPAEIDLEMLRYMPHLTRLAFVDIDEAELQGGWDYLRFVPKLEAFRMFTKAIDCVPIDAAGIRWLSEMPNLQEMAIGLDESLTGEDLLPLGRLEKLRYLHLAGDGFNAEQLRFIAQLKNLTHLRIDAPPRTPADEDGLRYIAQVASLSQLELTEISDAGMPFIGQMASLQRLTLTGEKITDAGSQHLEHFRDLWDLDVRFTGISDYRLDALRRHARHVRSDH